VLFRSQAPVEQRKLDGQPILKVKDLSLKNGYSDVSFEVRKGEILGITGLLGSGRTELVLSLFGIYPSEKGIIEMNGKPVKIKRVKDAIKYGIGYVPEDRLTEGLFLPQSIVRNIVVSKLDRLSNKVGYLNVNGMDAEVDKWIKNLSIATSNPAWPVQTLSGGNQQKVILARWLAVNLSVLILNGPTVGVDIGSKYDIHALLHSLAKEELAIIIISDDIPELVNNCNRILIMKNGKLSDIGPSQSKNVKELDQLITDIS
jgi:simple sugar transport system ATP-binding protein